MSVSEENLRGFQLTGSHGTLWAPQRPGTVWVSGFLEPSGLGTLLTWDPLGHRRKRKIVWYSLCFWTPVKKWRPINAKSVVQSIYTPYYIHLCSTWIYFQLWIFDIVDCRTAAAADCITEAAAESDAGSPQNVQKLNIYKKRLSYIKSLLSSKLIASLIFLWLYCICISVSQDNSVVVWGWMQRTLSSLRLNTLDY